MLVRRKSACKTSAGSSKILRWLTPLLGPNLDPKTGPKQRPKRRNENVIQFWTPFWGPYLDPKWGQPSENFAAARTCCASRFENVLPASPNNTSSAQTHKYPTKLYPIQSQHQVPRTWVKQHPKTPQTTKTNENPSPSSSMHKLVLFGSKLVPTWFL